MRILLAAVAWMCVAGSAVAQSVQAGSYLCTVEQMAAIGSTHLQGAGPPEVFTDSEVYRFRLRVTTEGDGRLRIVEAPYDGPDRSRYQWEDANSTLHSAYIGDGQAFEAEDGPGFLNFRRDRWGDGLQFYHSGFQYGGGEDESVAVRWGRCVVE